MSSTAREQEQSTTPLDTTAANRDTISAEPAAPSLKQTPKAVSEAELPAPVPRLVLAAAFVGLSLTGAVISRLDPGDQPLRLLAIIIVVSATVALASEMLSISVSKVGLRLGNDLLSCLGVAATIGASIATLIIQESAALGLIIIAPAAAAATLFFGRYLVARAHRLARSDRNFLFPLGFIERGQIAERSILSLKAGDTVPVDARITRGSCGIDERAFSSVAVFRIREEGDVILAGSQVLGGAIEAEALSTVDESCNQQLQRALSPMLEAAQEGLRREDAKASRATILGIIFLALAAAISWHERSGGYIDSLLAAGTVALIASLCQVAELLYGARRALVRGWLDRGLVLTAAHTPKQLAGVKRVVCDQSRLGQGSRYVVTQLELMDDRLSRSALCDCLASLLGRADDPSLGAAAQYCREVASKLSIERVLDLREYTGRGICGSVHGIELSVGNEDFLVARGIMVQPNDGATQESSDEELLLVAIDDDVVARFHISNDQEDLVTPEDVAAPGGIRIEVSSGVTAQFGGDTLLVRGPESDLVGQVAALDLRVLSSKEPELRPATVVALTPELGGIRALIEDCRRHTNLVERTRVLLGLSGLCVVVAVFAGLKTPLLPLAFLLPLGVSVRARRV